MNKVPAIIPNIYQDPRIPVGIYKPTFVKSLAIFPIRAKNPLGALGAYWSTNHVVTREEQQLLQALSDSVSIAIQNVQLYNDLERNVQERTSEIEAFSYSVSHDLQTPIHTILLLTELLKKILPHKT